MMTPSVFFKKAVRRLAFDFLRKFFFQEPRSILRFLYAKKMDVKIFSLPYFFFYNIKNLARLKRLRREGKNPSVVLFAIESDGRFDRLYEMSKADENVDSVWFQFPKECLAVEAIIFEEHTRRGCGFYEDARMKYIAPINEASREVYRQYLRGFFPALEKLTGPIDFFLSGSNHDRYVVEMVAVAQELGITWVVAEREGTGTRFSYKNEAECFKRSECVTADYFFTANEGHKYMMEHSKRDSVREVSVIGELDTDWWFHWDRKFTRKEYRKWDKYHKRVLFLTFGIRNYVESYAFPDNPEFNWTQLLAESEEEIFEFACRHRDVLVFYKMGHMEDNNPIFLAKCKAAGLDNVVPLDRSFPCNELILYSQLIIGFQSTAVFESMFSDNPIFYLNWAIPDGIDQDEILLPIANSGACTNISSQAHLAEMLERWYQDDPAVAALTESVKLNRKRTREIMFFNADGRVAERAWMKLQTLIAERRVGSASHNMSQ